MQLLKLLNNIHQENEISDDVINFEYNFKLSSVCFLGTIRKKFY